MPAAPKLAFLAALFGGALAGAAVAKLIARRAWPAWTVTALIALYVVLSILSLPLTGARADAGDRRARARRPDRQSSGEGPSRGRAQRSAPSRRCVSIAAPAPRLLHCSRLPVSPATSAVRWCLLAAIHRSSGWPPRPGVAAFRPMRIGPPPRSCTECSQTVFYLRTVRESRRERAARRCLIDWWGASDRGISVVLQAD